jgi:Tfp pilus assembly protein PilN
MEPEMFRSGLFYVMAIWGAVTVVLILLLIYRGQLANREGDQIFLAKGEDNMAAEQRTIVARIDALTRPIKVLYVVSGVLLVAVIAVWLETSWAQR